MSLPGYLMLFVPFFFSGVTIFVGFLPAFNHHPSIHVLATSAADALREALGLGQVLRGGAASLTELRCDVATSWVSIIFNRESIWNI
jgi:hypothetical protein